MEVDCFLLRLSFFWMPWLFVRMFFPCHPRHSFVRASREFKSAFFVHGLVEDEKKRCDDRKEKAEL